MVKVPRVSLQRDFEIISVIIPGVTFLGCLNRYEDTTAD
jgi:hypothetical protein